MLSFRADSLLMTGTVLGVHARHSFLILALVGAIASLLGGNELRATSYKLEPEVGIAPVESRSLLPSPSMMGEG